MYLWIYQYLESNNIFNIFLIIYKFNNFFLRNIVPDCGPRLIEQDIDIITSFKSLSPEKLLSLFQEFRKWSEYDENLFIPTNSIDELKVMNT